MDIYADVGGTHVRAWAEGEGKRIENLIIGLRGVWTSAEKTAWKKKFRGIAPKITVLSDVELAHRIKFGKGPGIVINAGTGAIAYGRNIDGKTARAGGLGPLVGDEGSAFWIGKEYLRMQYQIEPDHRVIRPYVVGANPVAKIAALAKKVVQIAEEKPNSFERRIVNEAFVHLRELLKEVRMKLRMPHRSPIGLTGGLFENKFFKMSFAKFLTGNGGSGF